MPYDPYRRRHSATKPAETLTSFSTEQAAEIHREIASILRPLQIRFWLSLAGFLIFLTVGFYSYSTTQQATVNRDISICGQLRKLRQRQIEIATVETTLTADFKSLSTLYDIIHQPLTLCPK